MHKVLIIVTSADRINYQERGEITKVQPGAKALEALQQFEYDAIIVGKKAALLMNECLVANPKLRRINVRASTHQGIQLVPITDVYYFQAEHKYVMTYHINGELLIDDSLDQLEADFSPNFIRIHRKTLAAIAKIERLIKNENNEYFVVLRESQIHLQVSRRQLASVRKALLCS